MKPAYPPKQVDGGADRDRTCDLLNAIQALYQLSYDPIRVRGENLLKPGELSKAFSINLEKSFSTIRNWPCFGFEVGGVNLSLRR
jgi:hypothetical protein